MGLNYFIFVGILVVVLFVALYLALRNDNIVALKMLFENEAVKDSVKKRLKNTGVKIEEDELEKRAKDLNTVYKSLMKNFNEGIQSDNKINS